MLLLRRYSKAADIEHPTLGNNANKFTSYAKSKVRLNKSGRIFHIWFVCVEEQRVRVKLRARIKSKTKDFDLLTVDCRTLIYMLNPWLVQRI